MASPRASGALAVLRTASLRTASLATVALATASLLLTACHVGADETPTLTIGTLLPETGSLAFLGPPEAAGVAAAVADINEQGGVLGHDVVVVHADSGDTSTNVAVQSVDRLLAEGSDAIIGAASSAVSLTVIDKITGAGVVQVSPANTAVKLSTYPDKGLYFRTAPPDTFQGAVLGQRVAVDGHATAAVLARQDTYGEGLAQTVAAAFTGAGGRVTTTVGYDPQTTDFAPAVSSVALTRPQAVVLIGFEESAKVVQELIAQGIGPEVVDLYLADGNLSNTAYLDLPAGAMVGTRGTSPGALTSADFVAKLLDADPSLTDFSYAGEAYDAVVLVALAVEAAGSTDGTTIAARLAAVSKDGERCTEFSACRALLRSGRDVDYDGVSGPIDLDANGDPTKAFMGLFVYRPDNTHARTGYEYVLGDVPAPS